MFLVLGNGNIGSKIAHYLNFFGFNVMTVDMMDTASINAVDYMNENGVDWLSLLRDVDPSTVINALPHQENLSVVQAVLDTGGINYMDLTEDVMTSKRIRNINETDSTFIPHCGLAPGLICILGANLIQYFDTVDTLELRVGALPRFVNNRLGYSVNWSLEGLINEYTNQAEVLYSGVPMKHRPLHNLETIIIDGKQYEAFTTSGGLGTMVDSFEGNIDTLNYKSIRYPGHLEYIKNFDLSSSDWLFDMCPPSQHDVVILYAQATGMLNDKRSVTNIVYEWHNDNKHGKAIHYTTALSCVAVGEILEGGYFVGENMVRQEDINFDMFMSTDAANLLLELAE